MGKKIGNTFTTVVPQDGWARAPLPSQEVSLETGDDYYSLNVLKYTFPHEIPEEFPKCGHSPHDSRITLDTSNRNCPFLELYVYT